MGSVDSSDGWRWLEELARGAEPEDAMLSLARLIVGVSGAERVLVASLHRDGTVAEAWGVDLDGLPLAAARERVPAALARAAFERRGPVYLRDVETSGGRGARLCVVSEEAPATRAMVVAEHRFIPGRFDSVSADAAERWAILAAIVLRLRGAHEAEPEVATGEMREERPEIHADFGHTTVVPVTAPRSFPGIVGTSVALRRALTRLTAALESELPVLLIGETGVGKELFARALHEHGRRARRPIVAVNCGAIPDALLEAELFGHARGSFTGAERQRPGLLGRAEGGTLFLDEVGELPLARQAALLRALETRRYRPVGSDDERAFDVRIVAATNRDLECAVREGTFRQDLFYRLNAVEIRVPPLRERPEDIELLVRSFLERADRAISLAPEVMAALSSHGWPGNVRELEHQVQRLAALGVERVELVHLPRALRAAARRGAPAGRRTASASPSAKEMPSRPRATRRLEARPAALEEARVEIVETLERTGGNISHAARTLGLTRHGLKKRMTRLGLRAAASDAKKE